MKLVLTVKDYEGDIVDGQSLEFDVIDVGARHATLIARVGEDKPYTVLAEVRL